MAAILNRTRGTRSVSPNSRGGFILYEIRFLFFVELQIRFERVLFPVISIGYLNKCENRIAREFSEFRIPNTRIMQIFLNPDISIPSLYMFDDISVQYDAYLRKNHGM